VTNPAGYSGSVDYDAYVFDGFAPQQQPARPSLIIGAKATQNIAWLPSSRSVTKPTFESRMENHRSKHVVLNDVSVNAARVILPI
jgi:hypothetical protein